MDVGQFSLEVEMEELIFQEMLVSPVEQYVQHLKDIYNINVKNASERTLLHLAVMLGKPDWVREILEAGADPLILDKYGHSALKIAKTMVSNHPGDKEREGIFKFLQSRHNNSLPTNVDLINNVKTLFSTEISASKKSIKEQISRFISVLTTELSLVKQSLEEENIKLGNEFSKVYALQSLMTTEHSSCKESMETKISGIRSYLTTELSSVKQSFEEVKKEQEEIKKELGNTVSKSLEDFKKQLGITVTTQKEALEKIRREQENDFSIVNNSLKQSVADLGNGIKEVDSMVTTLGESVAEVKKQQDSTVAKVDSLQSLLITEHSSCKESMDTQIKEIVAKLESLKNIGLPIPNPSPPIDETPKPVEVPTPTGLPTPQGPSTPEYKPNREACVEVMMRKTELKPSNEGNISKMKRLYEMLYDEDRITSCILEFIRFQSSVKVLVDMESDNIGGIKPILRDHDGRERSGSNFYVFADFEERKAYVSGNLREERYAIAVLAVALSQLSFYLMFNNRGLPYPGKGDGGRFKGILEEAERKWRDGVKLELSIGHALLQRNQLVKEIYLISAVPNMIARYGSSVARSELSAQLPSLLEYYDQHVVATLSKKTKKIFESARG